MCSSLEAFLCNALESWKYRSLEAIAAALQREKVKYLIVGGVAVNAHGYERATQDLDLVIGLERENIIRGLHTLRGLSYNLSIPVTPEEFADPALRESWRQDKGMIVSFPDPIP